MNKNILFITWDVPYPASTGGKKATLSIILEKFNNPDDNYIILVIKSKNEDTKAAIDFFTARNIRIEFVVPCYSRQSQNRLLYIINYFKSLVSLKPHFARKYSDKNIVTAIDGIVIRNHISEIYFNSVNFGELFFYFKNKYKQIRYNLVVHNIEYILLSEFSDMQKSFLISLLFRFESIKMFFYERNMFKRFDLILFVSVHDREIMSELFVQGKQEIECWSQKLFSDKEIIQSGCGDYILFPGSIDFQPNMDGLSWFCKTINDKFMLRYPSIKIYVTGYCSEKNKAVFSKWENIIFTGYADEQSMAELYGKCICIISPIHKGSGVKIKVLEAIHSNIPIVMTRFSAQGVIMNRSVINELDNNPETFYRNLVSVLDESGVQ